MSSPAGLLVPVSSREFPTTSDPRASTAASVPLTHADGTVRHVTVTTVARGAVSSHAPAIRGTASVSSLASSYGVPSSGASLPREDDTISSLIDSASALITTRASSTSPTPSRNVNVSPVSFATLDPQQTFPMRIEGPPDNPVAIPRCVPSHLQHLYKEGNKVKVRKADGKEILVTIGKTADSTPADRAKFERGVSAVSTVARHSETVVKAKAFREELRQCNENFYDYIDGNVVEFSDERIARMNQEERQNFISNAITIELRGEPDSPVLVPRFIPLHRRDIYRERVVVSVIRADGSRQSVRIGAPKPNTIEEEAEFRRGLTNLGNVLAIGYEAILRKVAEAVVRDRSKTVKNRDTASTAPATTAATAAAASSTTPLPPVSMSDRQKTMNERQARLDANKKEAARLRAILSARQQARAQAAAGATVPTAATASAGAPNATTSTTTTHTQAIATTPSISPSTPLVSNRASGSSLPPN